MIPDPKRLHDDFTKNGHYGTLEFEYKAGELVFVRYKLTFMNTPYEKNSMAVPKGNHGTHDQEFSKNQ